MLFILSSCSLIIIYICFFQAEVCHILFLVSVDYTDSAEIAGTPPEGCTELPSCPVCLGGSQFYLLFSGAAEILGFSTPVPYAYIIFVSYVREVGCGH